MEILQRHDLIDVLKNRVHENQPLLAVCLGLQLLCEGSEESPQISGVGVFGVQVERFPSSVQVPQLGWNEVTPDAGTAFAETFPSGHAYFANSYRVTSQITGFEIATTDYGTPFISAVHRDRVLACQFHPELSGVWGQQWLQLWLDKTC
jgi:imidazole glycerol phosphate synthase glutamine amidotransferase subunit